MSVLDYEAMYILEMTMREGAGLRRKREEGEMQSDTRSHTECGQNKT